MSNIRHILRLHTQNRTKAEIIKETGIPRNTLKKYLKEFKLCGLNFLEINVLSDADLKELFVKPKFRIRKYLIN